MEAKGGWSYVTLPSLLFKSCHPFGWMIVKGFIDHYEIKQYKQGLTKSGELFLLIKASILQNPKEISAHVSCLV